MKRWITILLLVFGVLSIVSFFSYKDNEMNIFSKLFTASPSIPKKEMAEMVKNKSAVLIDVRTPSEFKAGHIKGATNYPLQNLKDSLASIKKYDKPMVAVCRSGMRSGQATKILNKNNIKTYNAGGWESFEKELK